MYLRGSVLCNAHLHSVLPRQSEGTQPGQNNVELNCIEYFGYMGMYFPPSEDCCGHTAVAAAARDGMAAAAAALRSGCFHLSKIYTLIWWCRLSDSC